MIKTPTITAATTDELQNWDKLLLKNPDGGEILQTQAMAKVKQEQGWQPEFWVYNTSFSKVYTSVLTRKFKGYGKMAYIIRGPGVSNLGQLKEIILANKAKKEFFAIKLEPPIEVESPEMVTNFIAKQKDLIKVKNIQPNAHTIIVDLTKTEDNILADFKQRARREIRKAESNKICVRQVEITGKTLKQMYGLYQETGERAGFFVRPFSYYQNFWQTFAVNNNGELYFAYKPDDESPIAGAYICKLSKKALYKDGGSKRTNAKHFAHLLQWEIIKSLKQQGVEEYDLHGIPPLDQIDNPNHSLAGLNIFKQSFSRGSKMFPGSIDQVIDSKIYNKWTKRGLRIHQALAHRVRHTTLY